MSSNKKKGDLDQGQREDEDGNQKNADKGSSNSQTPIRMPATAGTSNGRVTGALKLR